MASVDACAAQVEAFDAALELVSLKTPASIWAFTKSALSWLIV